MKITAYKTDVVTVKSHDLFALIREALPNKLEENTIVAVAAKVVSLCEGRAVPVDQADKDSLIAHESQYFTERRLSEHNISFTVTNNLFIPTAGIDESNANDHYILWPKDPQQSANKIREFLSSEYQIKNIGVIITDSTSRPMQRGTTGIAIAHSGFRALSNYVGEKDIFGRILKVQMSNIAQGLAAAAVVIMGEGSEQTPIASIEDADYVVFTGQNPTKEELDTQKVLLKDDLYAPLMKNAPWKKGSK